MYWGSCGPGTLDTNKLQVLPATPLMATSRLANTWVAAVAATGVILSAAYALWLYRRVVMGDLIKESLKSITDMTTRERAIFAPLVMMTILLGVYPSLVTDIIGPSTSALVENHQTALLEADTTRFAMNGE